MNSWIMFSIIFSVVLLISMMRKSLKHKRTEKFSFGDFIDMFKASTFVSNQRHQADRTMETIDSIKCGLVKGVCSAAFVPGTACGAGVLGYTTACEAALGGPEDPLADSCAAGSSSTLTTACNVAQAAGKAFGAYECAAALGCP